MRYQLRYVRIRHIRSQQATDTLCVQNCSRSCPPGKLAYPDSGRTLARHAAQKLLPRAAGALASTSWLCG
jgi:hypothetical protein